MTIPEWERHFNCGMILYWGIVWNRNTVIDTRFIDKAIAVYGSICNELEPFRKENDAADINHAWLLADYLRKKLHFQDSFNKAYEKKDLEALTEISDLILPELIETCEQVTGSFRKMWYKSFKPFGFEVIQIRQAGQKARLQEAQLRINDFIAGKIDKIEELEDKVDTFNMGGGIYSTWVTGSTGI